MKIYAGLSISEQEVRDVLADATFARPVQRGDLHADIDAGHRVVAIVDGRFQQSLAVSVGEIMDALRCGVRIYGASSLGALRAAELDRYGMIGHGAIYEHVRAASCFRDDYLGQLFFEGIPNHKNPSVPYINLHFALRGLLERRAIDEPTRAATDELYKRLHFSERDRFNLERAINEQDGSPELLAAARLAFEQPDQKHLDALSLLERIKTDLVTIADTNTTLAKQLREVRRFPALEPSPLSQIEALKL